MLFTQATFPLVFPLCFLQTHGKLHFKTYVKSFLRKLCRLLKSKPGKFTENSQRFRKNAGGVDPLLAVRWKSTPFYYISYLLGRKGYWSSLSLMKTSCLRQKRSPSKHRHYCANLMDTFRLELLFGYTQGFKLFIARLIHSVCKFWSNVCENWTKLHFSFTFGLSWRKAIKDPINTRISVIQPHLYTSTRWGL